MRFLLIFILFIFTIISGTLTTFPLVLLLLLNFAVVTKNSWVFAAAFLAGLLLDILSLNTLGRTSLFFLIFVFIVILYERKFETQTYLFVFISSFLGSLAYLIILGYPSALIQSIYASLAGVLLFFFLKKFFPTKKDLLSDIR